MTGGNQCTGKIPGTMLTLEKFAYTDKWAHRHSWYRCDCGNLKRIAEYSVRVRKTVSCGCWGEKLRKNPEINKEKGRLGGRAVKGRKPEIKDKVLIRDCYSRKGWRTARTKWVTLEELRQIYAGEIPDPFA